MICPTSWKAEPATRRCARLPVARDRRGFTLLELLLVVGVMGLALGLGLPRVGAVREAYFAAEEAREVAGVIRAARHDAVANRTTFALTAAPGDRAALELRRLPIGSWTEGDSMSPFADDRNWRDIENAAVVRRVEVSGQLRLDSAEPGIVFFANGSSTGGEILILDDDGGLRRHFRIDPGTGDLVVQPGPGS